MASIERPKSGDKPPADLLAALRASGILNGRLLSELQARVGNGDYPSDPKTLAERLVKDRVLTPYQARRLLTNRPRGLVVGRYVILDRIGSGSMGRVYKAHHVMMDRVVALKVIAPEFASNERAVARFQREMRLVGRLDHENVVRAFDADQSGGMLFIVMEYVRGQSLGERLKRGGPIPAPEMIEYAAQAALGLAHAHAQGMVHRDVKPSNLLLSEDRRIKVLDLGLGVLIEPDNAATFATADGIAVGTVDYMSPEQALGRGVDGRSDLFSLGCAMYHLITGKLAFPGESQIDRLGRRLSAPPAPVSDFVPDFPASAARVLDKLMAPKPKDRFETAAEAAEALHALIRPKTRKSAPPHPEAPAPPATAPPLPSANGGGAGASTASPPRVQDNTRLPRLAALAARRPIAVPAGLVIALILAFAAGVGVGCLWR